MSNKNRTREEWIDNLLIELNKNHSRRRKNAIKRRISMLGASQRIPN